MENFCIKIQSTLGYQNFWDPGNLFRITNFRIFEDSENVVCMVLSIPNYRKWYKAQFSHLKSQSKQIGLFYFTKVTVQSFSNGHTVVGKRKSGNLESLVF